MTTQFDYTGKIALVTGAGTCNGRAAAVSFGTSGASVAVKGLPVRPPIARRTQQGRKGAIVGRAGSPKEIARTVLWLCSDLAVFTIGSNVVVNGAQTV